MSKLAANRGVTLTLTSGQRLEIACATAQLLCQREFCVSAKNYLRHTNILTQKRILLSKIALIYLLLKMNGCILY